MASDTDPVIQSVELGPQWPTIDPFLFCANHIDDYPNGNDELGPDATLKGRQIGSDFAGVDGWNMYHGSIVPGFPQHPHRGFETVTVIRSGYVDHADSLGATARFSSGDVQWMTAGSGIVHAEMFPLVNSDAPNPMRMFQIWLNLPAADKMVDPYFTMYWNEDIPRHEHVDDAGRSTEIVMVSGALDGYTAGDPPPNSWASRVEADVAIWHIRMDAGATWELPAAAGDETVRTLYMYEGETLDIGGHTVGNNTGNVVHCDRAVTLTAGAEGVGIIVLQGRPIGEPVARYGPFVMNTKAEIEQAFDDYQRTQFGGWPWPSPAPDHGPKPFRFARRPDGSIEHPPASLATKSQ